MSNNNVVQSIQKPLLNSAKSRKRSNAEIDSISALKVCEVELIYRSKVKASERFSIASSRDGIQLFRHCWDENTIELQEEFKVMLLNRALKVLGVCTISIGGLTSTVVDPKLIFSVAIKSMARSIIIAHNHPSGNLSPSAGDKTLTANIKKGAELFDINLLDSIIFTKEGFYSFAEEGIL